MLEKLKYATISSIYTKKLFFFDSDNKTIDYFKICKNHGISFLPDKDKVHIYKMSNSLFVKQELTPEIQINPYDRLFDKKTLQKFKDNNQDEVLFVTENNKIKGVVHIIDYNNEFIYYEFYKLIFRFEKMMRSLLTSKGETNQTLLEWMEYRGEKASKLKTREYWNNRFLSNSNEYAFIKQRDFKSFQTFLLSDLLEFAAYKNYISFKKTLNQIKSLRNWVFHNKDITSKRGSTNKDFAETESPLYNLEELNKFINSANSFFDAFEELIEIVPINTVEFK